MGMRPNATSGSPGRSYRFYTGTPVYAFGDGMSYTTFSEKWNDVEPIKVSAADVVEWIASDASQSMVPEANAVLSTASVTVTNTGKVAGDDVVLFFVKPPSPGVDGAPLKSLAGFERVHLAPGASKTVNFDVTARDLSLVDETGARSSFPGTWSVQVNNDGSSRDIIVG